MKSPVLTVESISKQYASVKALRDISFVLKPGDSLGLLGKNGSGKTTLLNIISGIKQATTGRFKWSGSPENKLNKTGVGILLEAPAFYPNLNAVDNLKITCLIKEMSFNEIAPVLKDVALFERRHLDFQQYSLGMEQRLGIASALIGNPELLILDEPTNGLDPEGIALVRSLIVKKRSEGAAVILASHILDEVEKTCSKLLVLNQGEKAFEGATKELLCPENQLALHYHDLDKLKKALKELSFISRLEEYENYVLITLPEGFDGSDVSRLLMMQEVILSEIHPRKKSLEDELLKLLAE